VACWRVPITYARRSIGGPFVSVIRRGPIIDCDTADEARERAAAIFEGDLDYVSTGDAIFMHDGDHRTLMRKYLAELSQQHAAWDRMNPDGL